MMSARATARRWGRCVPSPSATRLAYSPAIHVGTCSVAISHVPPVPRTRDLPVAAFMFTTSYRFHSVILSASVTVCGLSPLHMSFRPLVVTSIMSSIGQALMYLLCPILPYRVDATHTAASSGSSHLDRALRQVSVGSPQFRHLSRLLALASSHLASLRHMPSPRMP